MFGHKRKPPQTHAAQDPSRRKRHFLAYKRRWLLWGSFTFFIGGLITYNVLTQDERVRLFVQNQVSDILNTPVHVERARFSILRGLSVEDVSLYVDDANLPDSRFIQAGKLELFIRYQDLFKLKLRLESIQARQVRVLLCEDMQDHRFNLQRLLDRHPIEPHSQPAGKPSFEQPKSLPTIILSDASVTYARKSGRELAFGGDLRLDATIVTMPQKQFSFSILARTPGSLTATSAIAILDQRSGEISGRVSDLQLDHTLPNLLPAQVERFLQEFAFAGRFSIPHFTYQFPRHGQAESFDVTLAFKDVQAQIGPRHWLSRREKARLDVMRQTVGTLEMLGINAPLAPGELADDASEEAYPRDLLGYLQLHARTVPLVLDQLSGKVVFTPRQVNFNDLQCRLQGQSLLLNGSLWGYDADAPAQLHIQTTPGTYLLIPPSRQFITWLPDEVRTVYMQYQPLGKARLDLKLARATPGGPFTPNVQLDVVDTLFIFDDFPYPLRRCNGRLVFSHDDASGEDTLKIEHIRGQGVLGGPNENSFVEVNGTVGPFVRGSAGANVTITGENISSEPAIRQAFPREVKKAMQLFGPLDYAQRRAEMEKAGAPGTAKVKLSPEDALEWPRFSGNFLAHIVRPAGPKQHWTTDVRLDLKKAGGTLLVFPYPMENLSCIINIHDDALTLENLQMHRGDATLQMDGTVKFTDPADPDLKVKALNVPITADLLNALPPTERSWLQRAGLGGHVDIAGRIFLAPPKNNQEPEVDFDLDLALHNATFLQGTPKAGTPANPAFTEVNGQLFLKPARLEIRQLTGKRGNGALWASGFAAWPAGVPDIQLKLNARDLLLDPSLRNALPAAAQAAWDQQKPEGTADLDLDYTHLNPGPAASTTRPIQKVHLALRPRKLSITPAAFPYRLDDLQGELVLEDQKLQLKNFKGHHGQTTLEVTGERAVREGGTGQGQSELRLTLLATNVHPADEQLLAALPATFATSLKALKASGDFNLRLDNFFLRPASPDPDVQTLLRRSENTGTGTTTRPSTQPSDLDFDATLSTPNGQFNIGAPVTDMVGWSRLEGVIRSNQLVRLEGSLNAASYKLMGREGSDFTAAIRRPLYSQNLLIENLKTTLAGGSVAGGVTFLTHDNGPAQYAVNLVAQNADVNAVAGESLQHPINGRLSASISVEGVFNDPSQRRGRGDVLIQGHNMYEAPVVLGLFRMVNFSLPVRDGVNEVLLSYILNSDRATFENVEMRSPGLRIYGTGIMDFATRKVDFTLNTENPDALKIPILGPLVKQAQKELLQIRVRGTLQEPQVKTSSFPTFQTTLNEVIQDVKQGRK